MSQFEITDEWLEKYMTMASDEMLQELEESMTEEDLNHEFSPEFEKKMKRLIWLESHSWIADFGKFMGKVAVVVICMLGVSLAVTMSVDAYRSKFFQTAQDLWEDSVIHTYFSGEDEEGFVPQEPAYIPEGYVEVSRAESEEMLSITYENENGEWLVWDQMLAVNGEQKIIDSEWVSDRTINTEFGVIYIYNYSEGDLIAYYEQDNYVFILSGLNFTDNDMIHIFESMY